MHSTLDNYPMTARVWIYMADRTLTETECAELEKNALAFVKEWAAHGKDLNAHAEVRHGRFLLLMVDEESHMASGCSIDSSVQFVKEAGTALNTDFFNRLLIAYRDDSGSIQTTTISELGKLVNDGNLNPQTTVFNNLVSTKEALEGQWEIPLSESPYQRWL